MNPEITGYNAPDVFNKDRRDIIQDGWYRHLTLQDLAFRVRLQHEPNYWLAQIANESLAVTLGFASVVPHSKILKPRK